MVLQPFRQHPNRVNASAFVAQQGVADSEDQCVAGSHGSRFLFLPVQLKLALEYGEFNCNLG